MCLPPYIQKELDRLVAKHGVVPPPWTVNGGAHPFMICWRMGYGEVYFEVFWAWWGQHKNALDTDQRIDYFRFWPPPAAWLSFMINAIWDLRSGKKEDNLAPDVKPRDGYQEQSDEEHEDEDEYEESEEEEGWLEPEGFNYTPYFKQIEALGFGTQQEFEEAFNAEPE